MASHVDLRKNNEPSCMHCGMELSLELVPTHNCFIGKDVFMNNENVLFTPATSDCSEIDRLDYDPVVSPRSMTTIEETLTESSTSGKQMKAIQPAVWTNEATLALLSVYEADKDISENPKKQGKLWRIIADGLLESFGIEMSKDQVQWKINALKKKYHECIDNISKSGRGSINFEWFEQMDEIFRKHRDAQDCYTVSSTIRSARTKSNSSDGKLLNPKLTSEKLVPCSSTKSHQETEICARAPSTKLSDNPNMKKRPCNVLSPTSTADTIPNSTEKRIRTLHGTGSKTAKAKLEIEKQWMNLLENKEKRDTIRDTRHARTSEMKKEELQLRKRQLSIKEKDIEVKKKISENKLKEKLNRHAEIMELEKMKVKLLSLKEKSKTKLKDTSDSDGLSS